MSQYRGSAARAMGDRLRAQRKAQRQARRKQAAAAFRASPAGQALAARAARRRERQKHCAVCKVPNPPEAAFMLHCCSEACYAIAAQRDDERKEARRLGIPVAVYRARLKAGSTR